MNDNASKGFVVLMAVLAACLAILVAPGKATSNSSNQDLQAAGEPNHGDQDNDATDHNGDRNEDDPNDKGMNNNGDADDGNQDYDSTDDNGDRDNADRNAQGNNQVMDNRSLTLVPFPKRSCNIC